MKKKMTGIVLLIILVCAQAMGAFAAGSRTATVDPAGDSAGKYMVTEGSPEKLAYLEESAPEVLALITEINEGTKNLDAIIAAAPELADELTGKTLITDIFELEPIDGGVLTDDGKYLVTLSVPELTEALTNVRLLHYSTERGLWEVVVPTDVDYTNKQITAEFEDLSPVAIVADVDESKVADKGTGVSPQTGMTSVWGIYMGAAVILALISGALFIKSRKKVCQ